MKRNLKKVLTIAVAVVTIMVMTVGVHAEHVSRSRQIYGYLCTSTLSVSSIGSATPIYASLTCTPNPGPAQISPSIRLSGAIYFSLGGNMTFYAETDDGSPASYGVETDTVIADLSHVTCSYYFNGTLVDTLTAYP